MNAPTIPTVEGHGGPIGRQGLVVILVAVISVAVVVVAVSATNVSSGPNPSGTLGWYSLNNSTRSIGLSFPICSRVFVTWYVSDGPAANFSVVPPEFEATADCHGPPPTNGSCSPSVCGYYAQAGAPVCFESGYSGQCSFTATQTGYNFLLWTRLAVTNTTTYLPSLGNLTVGFIVDYWPPIYT